MSDATVARSLTPDADEHRGATSRRPGATALGRRHPRLLPRVAAVLAGAALGAAFVPLDWWPLAPVAVGVLTLLVRGRTARPATGLGYLFGLGLCTVTISWIAMLGWWVAPILIAVMASWWALLGAALSVVQRLRAPWFWSATVWAAAEYGMARVPFGGFPWLRLVWTTIDQPLSGFLPVLGAVGTSWLLALLGQGVAEVLAPSTRRRTRARLVGVRAVAVVCAAAAFGGGELLKQRPVPAASGPTLRVGIVQGDVSGTSGSAAMGYARSVTVNHVSETVELMARARTGLDPMPDLVLWPENSTDVDPTLDFQTHQLMMLASGIAGRPLDVGAVMAVPGTDNRMTASLWWTQAGTVEARYDKRNLVPFGEYIPLRSLVLPLVPVLKQVGQQSVPGTGPQVLHGTLDDGRRVAVGPIICFELAWDETVSDTVRHGAQVVVVQSNNADYTGTGQPRQQFQITRGRAMELRREIVVSTTDSFSGLIDPRGRVLLESREGTAFARTVTVPERSGVTLGVRLDPWLDRLALLLALAGLWWGHRAGPHRGAVRRRLRSGFARAGRGRIRGRLGGGAQGSDSDVTAAQP